MSVKHLICLQFLCADQHHTACPHLANREPDFFTDHVDSEESGISSRKRRAGSATGLAELCQVCPASNLSAHAAALHHQSTQKHDNQRGQKRQWQKAGLKSEGGLASCC